MKYMVYDSETGEVYEGYYDKLIWDIAKELNAEIEAVKYMLHNATEQSPVVFGPYSAWEE